MYKISGTQIVSKAAELVNIPYEYGGKDLEEIDCSGFVYMVLKRLQVELLETIHYTNAQDFYDLCVLTGAVLTVEQARRIPGALMFVKRGATMKHVGISAGNNDTYEAHDEGCGCGRFQGRAGWNAGGIIMVDKIHYYGRNLQ